MSFIPFILQGAFFGYVLSLFMSVEADFLLFMGMCVINSALVVAYGHMRSNE